MHAKLDSCSGLSGTVAINACSVDRYFNKLSGVYKYQKGEREKYVLNATDGSTQTVTIPTTFLDSVGHGKTGKEHLLSE